MKNVAKYIRNITQLISPILDISYDMQKKYGNINFKDVQTSSIGMWQSQICVNATTSIVHTEDDCTYTFIHVPNQQFKLSKKRKAESMFIFKLNENKNITLSLGNSCSFLFSGKFLSHRQQTATNLNEGEYFYNIASYGNKKLFSHIKSSFKRELNDN